MKNRNKQLLYDIRVGTLQSWKLHLSVALISLLTCSVLTSIKSNFAQSYGTNVAWFDIITFLFEGQEEFSTDGSASFHMPFYWFLFQMGYLACVIRYPKWDFEEHGYQYFIRSCKKSNWWHSKCLWCIVEVCVYYGIILLTALAATLFRGGTLCWQKQPLIGCNLEKLSVVQLFLFLFILPILTSIPVALLGMVLSFYVNIITGYIVCMIVLVAETYWSLPFFPGEYIMLRRWTDISSSFYQWYGKALFISLLLGILCVVSGKRLLTTKSIY